MHTSTRLKSTDFEFRQNDRGQLAPIAFDAFCPDYHPLDRVGVVSPCLQDGVLHTAGALLALTTAFYDMQRSRATDFFDYPQHFAFVGADADGIHTHGEPLPVDRANLWDAWSWLDVWPECKWLTAPPTVTGMLKRVFDAQINRLFWPSDLNLRKDEAPLPSHVYKMLKTSLKAVYIYDRTGSAAGMLYCGCNENRSCPAEISRAGNSGFHSELSIASSALEIHAGEAATLLMHESIAQLPGRHPIRSQGHTSTVECYQAISCRDFLDQMSACFAAS